MALVGIMSDTHGYLHPRLFDFFALCDEIWHAGDIGSIEIINKLRAFKPLRAVWGNIDNHGLRAQFPEMQVFDIEDQKVLMMHIAGRPGKYNPKAMQAITRYKPGLLVAGHSHILQVKYDQRNKLLFINPGAAGIHGFHQKITMLRVRINQTGLSELEVLEIDRNNNLPYPVG